MPNLEEIRVAAREVVAGMVGKKVGDSDPLISTGLIDSLSILRLITRLENQLSVSIPPENLQPDDFETIDWIVDTVERTAISR